MGGGRNIHFGTYPCVCWHWPVASLPSLAALRGAQRTTFLTYVRQVSVPTVGLLENLLCPLVSGFMRYLRGGHQGLGAELKWMLVRGKWWKRLMCNVFM
jgi:hypothetical protein